MFIMKRSLLSLLLLVALYIPQSLIAQRFSHGGGGGGGGFRPAPSPPPVSRPAPQMVSRPSPAPVYNRPVPSGTINGGSRNAGNHDFNRVGNPGPPPAVNNNVHVNVHENVNVYHSNPRVTYRPYTYHPYHPYRWGPSWHPVGFFIASLAADAYLFSLANQSYYYDDGVYYEPTSGGYDVVAAPIGATVSSLPPGYETIMVDSSYYYYYGGTFYINTGQSYQVVQAPPGAIVSEIPDGATQQDINGDTYLLYNNTYYQPVSSNGQDAYQVVQMNN
jgi:hypothetical protein